MTSRRETTVGDQGDDYPSLEEVVVAFAKRGYDETEEVEFGLERNLDGLEHLRRTITSPQRSRRPA